MIFFKALLVFAFAVSLLPAPAAAKQDDKRTRIIVFAKPKQNARYGFLPGYRQPPPLSEWRDRSPRHGGGDVSRDRRRYISGYEWRYGWGYPQFHRGRWNGGGFGPCWTNTPIGPMWNCGM